MTLWAEAGMTGLLAAWMVTGVFDNWRYPKINRVVVTEVMTLSRMKDSYPEIYDQLGHRAIRNPVLVKLAFRLVVLWETLAAVLLSLGTVMLGLAALSGGDGQLAGDIALAGAIAFTATWGAFLAGGNYFCYYYCHFEAQFTHFMLVIWGAVVTAMLAL